jgi:hypothetical protein
MAALRSALHSTTSGNCVGCASLLYTIRRNASGGVFTPPPVEMTGLPVDEQQRREIRAG